MSEFSIDPHNSVVKLISLWYVRRTLEVQWLSKWDGHFPQLLYFFPLSLYSHLEVRLYFFPVSGTQT